jgi:biopolymer transport protein ExbB
MKFKFFPKVFTMLAVGMVLIPYCAFAADPATAAAATAAAKVTLWDLLKAGGWTMGVLGALSVFTLALVLHNFLTLRSNLLVPMDFAENLVLKLEVQDLAGAQVMCQKKKNIISEIALAGLTRRGKGKTIMREAMDNAAKREVTKLWQQVAFLGDVASIAPLLGLFGTVIGMIQAFNMITYAGANLKPMMLVGGISKALVTTAAGLVVAIPALAFYSFFRGKVQVISDTVAEEAADLMKLVEDPQIITRGHSVREDELVNVDN